MKYIIYALLTIACGLFYASSRIDEQVIQGLTHNLGVCQEANKELQLGGVIHPVGDFQ